MHRVFQDPAGTTVAHGYAFDDLRGFLRSLGLVEQRSVDTYLYWVSGAAGELRQFATMYGGRHHATIYVYASALGLNGVARSAAFRILDGADFAMGTKLGPSFGIDLQNTMQVDVFQRGLTALLATVTTSRGTLM